MENDDMDGILLVLLILNVYHLVKHITILFFGNKMHKSDPNCRVNTNKKSRDFSVSET